MKVDLKDIAYCVVILFSFSAGILAAEDGYIIGKEEDETLLNLSIVFLVMCALFLLVSILAGLALTKKMKGAKGYEGYYLEEQEEKYQSMYAGKTVNDNPYGTTIVHYETLKLPQINGSGNGVYQSLERNGTYQSADYAQPNGHAKTEQSTPPGTANGRQKTLSSFQNPAYESSMPAGLDKEVEIKPTTPKDDNEDTSL